MEVNFSIFKNSLKICKTFDLVVLLKDIYFKKIIPQDIYQVSIKALFILKENRSKLEIHQ